MPNLILPSSFQGFRIDAAKHMHHNDINAILSLVNDLPGGGSPYIFTEVIDLGGEAVGASDYFYLGDVTDFRYSREISYKFTNRDGARPSDLQYLNSGSNVLPSADGLVFIDNHDNQRYGHGGVEGILTHVRREKYSHAMAFMLAYPWGRPRIMSSYKWDRNIQSNGQGGYEDFNSGMGPPSSNGGFTWDADCSWIASQNWADWTDVWDLNPDMSSWPAWICEHRWPVVAPMVGFYNQMSDSDGLNNWWNTANGWGIAFGVGNKGFVVINSDDNNVISNTLNTGLPEGTYCDIIK